MAVESVPLEYLFTAVAKTEPQANISGDPQGSRVMVNVLGGTFDGPRRSGTILGTPGKGDVSYAIYALE